MSNPTYNHSNNIAEAIIDNNESLEDLLLVEDDWYWDEGEEEYLDEEEYDWYND